MTSHPDTSPPEPRPLTRERGPVEILCKEIGFHFDRRMERPEVLMAFVRELVQQVRDMQWFQAALADKNIGEHPSPDMERVMTLVDEMLASNDSDAMIAKAAAVHEFIDVVAPDEKVPCDHLIDMLSSCVSAIRFGLEKLFPSRHAAEAAGHVWRHKYGLTLFDTFTPAWQREWTCAQLQAAIVSIAFPRAEKDATHGK